MSSTPRRSLRDLFADPAWCAEHPWRHRVGLVAATCRELAAVHARGGVVRELTPSAILVDATGVTLRMPSADGSARSPAALAYQAPEVVRGEAGAHGPGADLFALGAILYESLTGVPAFAGPSPLHVRLAILEGQPRAPKDLAGECPPALSTLCLELLASQRDLRPSSAQAVAAELAKLVEGEVPPGCTEALGPPEVSIAPPPAASPPAAESMEKEITVLARPLASAPVTETHDELAFVERQRYELQETIATGGLGRILRARDRRLDRPVAVKELLYTDRAARDRFKREVRLTARLQHPSIVPLYEAGRWPDGEPFYAMKLVAGRPLAEVLAARTGLAERLSLLPRLIDAVEAVAYAHAQGIVHRDLKPHNILIGEFGETVVIDWGLAKDLREREDVAVVAAPPYRAAAADAALTVVGSVLGTPAYMPPEQAAGEPVDERADVYALGAILYHLLGGRAPYEGASPQAIIDAVGAGPPTALEVAQPGVPRDLLTIVHKAMQRDPGRRYPTARELGVDLKNFQTGQLVGAHAYTPLERVGRFARRHRGAVSVGSTALLVMALGATLAVRRILDERQVARARADDLALLSARAVEEHDPRRTLEILAGLSPDFTSWGAARLIAADVLAQARARVFDGVQLTRDPQDGAVDLSPDGRVLAYADRSHAIILQGLEGAPNLRLAGDAEVLDVVFAPDGKTLAWTSADGLLHLWDVPCLVAGKGPERCGARLVSDGARPSDHSSLAFSPDSLLLAWVQHKSEVRLVAVPERAVRAVFDHASVEGETLTEVAFAPDGNTVASIGIAGELSLWDVHGLGKGPAVPHVTEPAHRVLIGAPLFRIAFAPDSRQLAVAGYDETLRLFATATGAAVAAPIRASGGVLGMAFSPDGRLLAYVGADEKVRIATLGSGETSVLAGHEAQVTTVAFSPDGLRLASGSSDAAVRLWDLRTGQSRALPGHREAIEEVRFSADGRQLLSLGSEGRLQLWDLAAQGGVVLPGIDKDAAYLDELGHRLRTMAFSADGRLLSYAGPGHELQVRDRASGATTTLGSAGGPIMGLAVAPDGTQVAAARADGSIQVGGLGPGEASSSHTLRGHTGRVLVVAFAPDGRLLASGGEDGTVRLWTIDPAPKLLTTLEGHTSAVISLAFSRDGRRLASGSKDRTVRLWATAGDPAPRVVGTHRRGWPVALQFTRDDTALLSSGGETTRLWSLTGGSDGVFDDLNAVNVAALSPDGVVLALAHDDNSIRLWDTARHAVRAVVRGHANTIVALAFSPDGQTLVSAGYDGAVRLTDVATGQSRIVGRHAAAIYQVAFSPDGDTVASASFDGTVALWDDSLPHEREALRRFIAAHSPLP